MVFVTHDVDEAIRLADRIAVLRAGSLVQYDAPEALLDGPADAFIAGFLGLGPRPQAPVEAGHPRLDAAGEDGRATTRTSPTSSAGKARATGGWSTARRRLLGCLDRSLGRLLRRSARDHRRAADRGHGGGTSRRASRTRSPRCWARAPGPSRSWTAASASSARSRSTDIERAADRGEEPDEQGRAAAPGSPAPSSPRPSSSSPRASVALKGLLGLLFPGTAAPLYPRAALAFLVGEHLGLVAVSSLLAAFVGIAAGILATRPGRSPSPSWPSGSRPPGRPSLPPPSSPSRCHPSASASPRRSSPSSSTAYCPCCATR